MLTFIVKIKNFIMYRLISAYGFHSFKGLLMSLFPSVKYDILGSSLTFSAIFGLIAQIIGFSPVIVAVMFVAVIVETMTGIQASRKRGEHFESWKFSRCIMKVCIWIALMFMMHSFAKEMSYYEGVLYAIAAWFFQAFHITTMIYFCVEYAVSIAENFAVIDGKKKTAYIEALQELWHLFKEQIKKQKQ